MESVYKSRTAPPAGIDQVTPPEARDPKRILFDRLDPYDRCESRTHKPERARQCQNSSSRGRFWRRKVFVFTRRKTNFDNSVSKIHLRTPWRHKFVCNNATICPEKSGTHLFIECIWRIVESCRESAFTRIPHRLWGRKRRLEDRIVSLFGTPPDENDRK